MMKRRGTPRQRYFPGMKRPCAQCDEEITVTEQMCKYGKYVCGPCQTRRATEYGRRNLEKRRLWSRTSAARRSKEIVALNTKQYRARHPERRHAHQAVQTAVRNGTLKAQPCVVCGNPKTHAHHDDYTKPLDVIWFCHIHHMEHHATLAELARRQGEYEVVP